MKSYPVKQPGVERACALRVCAHSRTAQCLDRKLRVAVIGGGPSGACTAETLAKGGIETVLIERKLDNCKVSFCVLPACQHCPHDLQWAMNLLATAWHNAVPAPSDVLAPR